MSREVQDVRAALERAAAAGPVGRSGRALRAVVYGVLVLGAVAAALAFAVYRHLGRTPTELMDYSQRRLEGHPRLERVALPVMGSVRNWLDAPTLPERRAQRFVIPLPPALQSGGPKLAAARPELPARRVVRVGPAETVRSIAEAARTARDDDVVEIQAGEYRGDVALWNQKRLTIRAIGGHARIFADGKSAEGKAIWVIRNGDFDISGIDFIDGRVTDMNGAGIRFENGRLRVADCLFWGNENGILANGNDIDIEISGSEFGYSGAGTGLSHHLYVGTARSLVVTVSYFHHTNIGHMLKSRAARSEVTYNRFTDEIGGRASYELDFPNGGTVYVVGNIVQQTRETENSTMIAFGEEGLVHAANHVTLSGNTLVNDHPHNGAFLRIAGKPVTVSSMNNLFVGAGRLYDAPAVVETNNVRADWDVFVQASRYDYRLLHPGPSLAYRAVQPGTALPETLPPPSEYVHPLLRRRLSGPPSFVGALQTGP